MTNQHVCFVIIVDLDLLLVAHIALLALAASILGADGSPFVRRKIHWPINYKPHAQGIIILSLPRLLRAFEHISLYK